MGAGERGVEIGGDANGAVIATGDGNFIFPGVKVLSVEVVEAIRRGTLKPADAEGAVPLPTLVLRIAFVRGGQNEWDITATRPGPKEGSVTRRLPVPWRAEQGFAAALEGFWRLGRKLPENDDDVRS